MPTHEAIRSQLDAISAEANARRLGCDGMFAATVGGATIDFMTPDERVEYHRLQLMLPTYAEEREAATQRIRVRLAARPAHWRQTANPIGFQPLPESIIIDATKYVKR